jgi:hypothetical protein
VLGYEKAMATSKSLSFQVSDVIRWFKAGELVINETFQRHAVWTAAAKTYLIDTILCELPVPKIYIRTRINTAKQSSLREVVDGQQRVRAMVEFSTDKLRLTSRSEDFRGKVYSELDPETQEKFLGYTLSVEQLLNASDNDVIDIFARLNSYIVPLNAAEKRHASFQTEFKFAVRKASHDWRAFWEKYSVFSTKQRFRMADDVLMAEMFQLFLEGVSDGGAPRLERLYRDQDDETFTEKVHKATRSKVDECLCFVRDNLADALGGAFSKHYQLLMLVAAYAHHKFGIPAGDIDNMPPRESVALPEKILDRLAKLEDALLAEEPPSRYKKFVDASSSSTQRIASRRVRFFEFVKALAK